jgi:hypothetical protein
MPSLTRVFAFVLFGGLGYFGAEAYAPIFSQTQFLGRFSLYVSAITAAMAWAYLGGQVGRGWLMSAYMGVQTVVLSAIITAGIFAFVRVWVQGYRQRYGGDLQRAFESYFDYMFGYLRQTLILDPLVWILLAGAILGVGLQYVFTLLERRRLAR